MIYEPQDEAELLEDLAAAKPGETVRLDFKHYHLSEGLVVKSGVTLDSPSKMVFEHALPEMLELGPELLAPTLVATEKLVGDLVLLSEGARIRGIHLVDTAGRAGNLLAVRSRRPGDVLEDILIEECAFTTKNAGSGDFLMGPIGRAILLLNATGHEGSRIAVRIDKVRSYSTAATSGLMAINFSSSSRIDLEASQCRFTGNLDAAAGVSRASPEGKVEATSNARIDLDLDRCQFEAPESVGRDHRGWYLHGGTFAPGGAAPASDMHGNFLKLRASRSGVSGYPVGIYAVAAARRVAKQLDGEAPTGLVNGSRLLINLDHCSIRTRNNLVMDVDGIAPFKSSNYALAAVRSGGTMSNPFKVGDDNYLRIDAKKLRVSPWREDLVLDAATPGELVALVARDPMPGETENKAEASITWKFDMKEIFLGTLFDPREVPIPPLHEPPNPFEKLEREEGRSLDLG